MANVFSSDANADFEGFLEENREICMPQAAEKQRRMRRRIGRRCLNGRVFRHCPRGWSQYLQRMGAPLRTRFFAPQPGQTHCTRAPSGIYSPTVRFSESILRFCRYPLPMSDWSCSRALPEERTVSSRSKVRLSAVSGSSAPAMRCGGIRFFPGGGFCGQIRIRAARHFASTAA